MFNCNLIGNVAAPPTEHVAGGSGKPFLTVPLLVTPTRDVTYRTEVLVNGALMETMRSSAQVGKSLFVSGRASFSPRIFKDKLHENLKIALNQSWLHDSAGMQGYLGLQFFGRMKADPEIHEGPNQRYVRARVAVNIRSRKSPGTEEVMWISVTAFASQAKRLLHAKKGQVVYLEGRATINSYVRGDGEPEAEFEMIPHVVLLRAHALKDRPQVNGNTATPAAVGFSR